MTPVHFPWSKPVKQHRMNDTWIWHEPLELSHQSFLHKEKACQVSYLLSEIKPSWYFLIGYRFILWKSYCLKPNYTSICGMGGEEENKPNPVITGILPGGSIDTIGYLVEKASYWKSASIDRLWFKMTILLEVDASQKRIGILGSAKWLTSTASPTPMSGL